MGSPTLGAPTASLLRPPRDPTQLPIPSSLLPHTPEPVGPRPDLSHKGPAGQEPGKQSQTGTGTLLGNCQMPQGLGMPKDEGRRGREDKDGQERREEGQVGRRGLSPWCGGAAPRQEAPVDEKQRAQHSSPRPSLPILSYQPLLERQTNGPYTHPYPNTCSITSTDYRALGLGPLPGALGPTAATCPPTPGPWE